ncbi:hypothetical protein GCM10012275_00640 [Longimycelium tulufanense]|uniref:Glycosyl hydrolase n=1 Tax=Longimycelium tulufanense TaxID=907463 RepID=A0A8J3C5T7_9PSEU|nr:cellulase family glycosylhydrolase [Longimycelium tulufanense]GGM33078.1 hypothetical protein GCM10012275_00640 [Longimycelium tulufanense]
MALPAPDSCYASNGPCGYSTRRAGPGQRRCVISTQQEAPRFGANYTPSEHWWHTWLDFDTDSIRRDFAGLAELGLDHVRVFCVWPVFQPNRGTIRPRAIAQLVEMVHIARECGLDISVDALQGHLSSFDFYPSWTQTWHQANIFTDPDVIHAQAVLLTNLAETLRDEPNFLGITLGNEPNNLVPHNPCGPSEVDAWLDRLLRACQETDPAHPHCHSAYDAVWYVDGHPFTPRASATKGAMTVVHPWVFTNNCARRYGPLSVEATHLAEYAVELSKAYADDANRMVWVQEVGAPDGHIPVYDAPEFAVHTLSNVVDARNVWGVTWWCSHDVSRRFLDYPELEYGLGLLRSDRSRKPLAKAFAETISHLRAIPPRPEPRKVALVLEGGRGPSGPGGAFFEAWMRLTAAGARPAVVLGERTNDAEHLANRGITELLRPHETL